MGHLHPLRDLPGALAFIARPCDPHSSFEVLGSGIRNIRANVWAYLGQLLALLGHSSTNNLDVRGTS